MAVSVRRVGLFRALLTAHAQMMVNRGKKGLGRRGMIGIAIVFVLLLAGAAPLFMTFAFLGFLLGHGIDKPLAAPLMGGILLVVTMAFGVVGGLLGGARQLTWDAYRSFPVPFRTLFLAETFASLGDLVVLGFIGILLALGATFAWQQPALTPLAAFVLGQLVLWVLFLQHLVGSLAVGAVRRLRRAMVLVVVATWVGITLISGTARELRQDLQGDRLERLLDIWHRVRPVLELVPPVRAVEGIVQAHRHAFALSLWLELPMALVTVALGAASYWLLHREASPARHAVHDTTARGRRLAWTRPSWGIARLHIHHVAGSLQGRFGLVVPLITMVLVKGPLGTTGIAAKYTVPGSVIYLALASTQFHFNQWGFDGQGVKTLFLLPVATRDLLVGKTCALLLYCIAQNALLLALLALLVHAGPRDLLAGALLAGSIFVAHALEGGWISVLYPRALAMHRMNSTGLSGATLLPLGVGVVNSLVFGGAYSLLLWLSPNGLIPFMTSMLLTLIAVYRILLPRTARFVEAHRETVVEVLG